MGQRPIGVRVKAKSGEKAGQEAVVISVGEAARRLGVSERTVFRMLKTGVLERADIVLPERVVTFHDDSMSDMKDDKANGSRSSGRSNRFVTSPDDSHNVGENGPKRVEYLVRQVQERDAQIAQLLLSQQEMTQTCKRLQEQMYELAHLVLSHNAAAAQAKAQAELKVQEQALAASRRGLSGLLSARKRSQR